MASKKKETNIIEENKKDIEKKPVKKVSKKNHIKITYPGVNVRSEASLESAILTIAYEGDKFELYQTEQINGFYKIKFERESGFAFIMSNFVKIV